MQFAHEQHLRNEALALWKQGVLSWDRGLRSNGLDPFYWSTGGRTAIPAPEGYARPSRVGRHLAGMGLHFASFRSQTFNATDNTVELIWSTGAAVQRQDYEGSFLEVLDMNATSVRLGRLNAGAPFLDSHASYDLGDVIGSVIPGSARIANGKGTCKVLLASSADCADAVSKIRTGVVRNVSVGYLIHGTTWAEDKAGLRTCRVTDWEPIEISAVAIPADAGAQIRSA